MASKKKLATSVAAVATAAALLLGGTFAWQSANQTALNEGADTINPGGRLHDDFDGTNKDVYVENFTDPENGGQNIFARVRLEEYLEVVLNYGTPGETEKQLLGEKYYAPVLDEDGEQAVDDEGNPVYETEYTYEYVPFTGYDSLSGNTVQAGVALNDDSTSYWNWQMGGSTVYMPTFNMNKDSLEADINGEYKYGVGVITDKNIEGGQYSPMKTYTDGETKTANEIWDTDSNDIDELAENGVDINTLIEQTGTDYDSKAVKLVNNTHTAQPTLDAQLISMSEWLTMVEDNGGEYDPDVHGGYWVYDNDGWVYWSAPIAPGTATGLLLDGIALNQVMDDSWYYAINVVGQFVTADDAGAGDGTGFYDETKGEVPSWEAEQLLITIGVTLDGSEDDDFVAQAGTVNSDGGISLDIDSPYINVNGNAITINAPAASADDETWYTATTNLSGTALTWGSLSSRIVYKLDEETGEYEEWGSYVTADNEDGYVDSGSSEPFDVCMGEGLDIFLGSADAGTYKIVGSGTDADDSRWTGELVLTVDYVISEGGDEDEEPEDPYGFRHLLLGYNPETVQSATFKDHGYAQPGDSITFSAVAYYNDGTTAAINSENAIWKVSAVEGKLAQGTSISANGELTISEDQDDLTAIKVEVLFTDRDGNEHTKEQSFLVSEEAVTLKLEIIDDAPYYTGTGYHFTATATNASGKPVPMEWSYDMGSWKEGEQLSARVESEAIFYADDAGEYYLRAWAEYLTGHYAESFVTVVKQSEDTTAPTVSVEMKGYSQGLTISNLNDADFPLLLNLYQRTGGGTDETAIFDTNPYKVIAFSLTADGVTADSDHMSSIRYTDGSLTADYNAAYDGLKPYNEIVSGYGLKLVTVDASQNISEEAIANWNVAEGCFVAGTQVQTVNGLVNIEDIKLGDMVYSIDLTTDTKVVNPVTWVQGTRYIDATYTIYAGDEKVVTTYEHPFYVIGKEWVAAEDLVKGDKIKTVDGEVAITDIVYTQLDAPVQVYNFTVDGTHNYLISETGLLVHNIAK